MLGQDGPPGEPTGALSRQRVRLVYAVMAVIVAGSVVDMVTGREHWPFSPYPMYAGARSRPDLVALRLFGVTAGPRGEIPLVSSESLYPFSSSRIEGALWELRRRGGN